MSGVGADLCVLQEEQDGNDLVTVGIPHGAFDQSAEGVQDVAEGVDEEIVRVFEELVRGLAQQDFRVRGSQVPQEAPAAVEQLGAVLHCH